MMVRGDVTSEILFWDVSAFGASWIIILSIAFDLYEMATSEKVIKKY